MDAIRPEQRGPARDGLVPVGQLGVLAVPGGRGERRVDRVLPGLRACPAAAKYETWRRTWYQLLVDAASSASRSDVSARTRSRAPQR
jgi:hypothetical protein